MNVLQPFASTPLTDQFKIFSDLQIISAEKIEITFQISGPLDKILWPDPAIIESRQDELWKTTCLETFLGSGPQANDSYTEVNCSPNGNWNAYSFSSYREGMSPSPDITVRLKEKSTQGQNGFFKIELLSTKAIAASCVGLTAVIEFTTGEKAYWALRHPKSTADFHDKTGWKT
ncbi:DOMON-like domain-containing protein [Bdellovibrio reynosensis]|uniref:DOMON-like domain-containing protein n=1 Tax=Bdellovibrio reynosensis TaxID=2835041 RepID=A0ABY4CDL6_9BACT|nr:DOMON-like domain-containing protein [Bdellovibrio reynosensis]UOF01633.1 DOMON-like domain-containing protein [Bdellovibrio reynosensis]